MFPIQPDDPSSSAEELQQYVQEEETPIVTTPIMSEEATLPSIEGQQPAIPTSEETTLPPEAQGETHGGPLGCCLGTVIGLFLTVMLLLGLSLLLSNGGTLGVATIPVIILGSIIGSYFGWRIGRRVYKEYEPPVVKRQYRSTPTKKKRRKIANV